MQRLSPLDADRQRRRSRLTAPGFFGTDGAVELRGRAADLQDPAPPQHVPEGRHVRLRRPGPAAARASPATRYAASASSTTAPSTRSSVSTARRSSRRRQTNPGGFANDTHAPQHGRVHAGVRLEPGADRRPADHAHRDERRRSSIRASTLLEERADRGECDLVAKGVVGEMRGQGLLLRRRPVAHRHRGRPHSDHEAALRARADDGRAGGHVHLRAAGLRHPRSASIAIVDGAADGDERDAGTDPRTPRASPSNAPPICTRADGDDVQARDPDGQARRALTHRRDRRRPVPARRPDIVATDSNGMITAAAVPGRASSRKRADSGATSRRTATPRKASRRSRSVRSATARASTRSRSGRPTRGPVGQATSRRPHRPRSASRSAASASAASRRRCTDTSAGPRTTQVARGPAAHGRSTTLPTFSRLWRNAWARAASPSGNVVGDRRPDRARRAQ